MRAKTIHLDSKVRAKIVTLLKHHDTLIQHRNARLGRVSAILYGIAIGAGYLLVMGIIKTGWFDLATPLVFVVAVSWLVAEWVAKHLTAKPLKLNIK